LSKCAPLNAARPGSFQAIPQQEIEMPREGAITFSDLAAQIDVLRVECVRCDRHCRYSVAKLIGEYSGDGDLIEWFSKLTADCHVKRQRGVRGACDAAMPDLPRLMSRRRMPTTPPPEAA
jgi:hypothetical protein